MKKWIWRLIKPIKRRAQLSRMEMLLSLQKRRLGLLDSALRTLALCEGLLRDQRGWCVPLVVHQLLWELARNGKQERFNDPRKINRPYLEIKRLFIKDIIANSGIYFRYLIWLISKRWMIRARVDCADKTSWVNWRNLNSLFRRGRTKGGKSEMRCRYSLLSSS